MRAGGCSLAASRKVGGPRSPRSFLQPPAASMRVGLPIPSPRSAGRPLNRIASRLQRAVTYRILSYRILFYSISSVGWTLDGSVERSSRRVQSQSQALPLSFPPRQSEECCITRTVPGRQRQAVCVRARRSIRWGSRRRSQEARRWLVAEPYQVHKLPARSRRGGSCARSLLSTLAPGPTGASSSGVLRRASSEASSSRGAHIHARKHEEPPVGQRSQGRPGRECIFPFRSARGGWRGRGVLQY